MWVDRQAWGPLEGSLLNFSYGEGKIYVVPHEKVAGQVQGGMFELPLPRVPDRRDARPLPSGKRATLLAAACSPGPATSSSPAGSTAFGYTGKSVHLPVGISAWRDGIALSFTSKLDRAEAGVTRNFLVSTWSLKRTANYGSPHVGEKEVKVTARHPVGGRQDAVSAHARSEADVVHGDRLYAEVGRGRVDRGRDPQHAAWDARSRLPGVRGRRVWGCIGPRSRIGFIDTILVRCGLRPRTDRNPRVEVFFS